MPITITGTPNEILGKLESAKEVATRRNDEGWMLFQDDEEWRYEVVSDFRTCYICNGFAGRWVGTQVPIEFSHYKRWGKNHVKPGTHADYPQLKPANAPDTHEGCRCNLWWYDYMFVLTNRLFREIEEATI